jgi:hypothetical protein
MASTLVKSSSDSGRGIESMISATTKWVFLAQPSVVAKKPYFS